MGASSAHKDCMDSFGSAAVAVDTASTDATVLDLNVDCTWHLECKCVNWLHIEICALDSVVMAVRSKAQGVE